MSIKELHCNIPALPQYIAIFAQSIFHTLHLYLSMKYIICYTRVTYIIHFYAISDGFQTEYLREASWFLKLLFIICYQKGPLLQAHVLNSLPFSPMPQRRPPFFRTLESITLTELIFINLSLENSSKAVFCIKVVKIIGS